MKAKRLTQRFNSLPERYVKVIERCRDPKTLPQLEEIRNSRPERKVLKAQALEERQKKQVRISQKKTERRKPCLACFDQEQKGS